MKRRNFLIAMGAVPVATYFGVSTGAAQPVELYHNTPFVMLKPWQERLWRMLESGKKVMYVTGTQKNAWDVFNLFKRHKNLFTTSINAAVMGRRADTIIIDDFTDDINMDWYNQCVRTRLSVDGEIEWIHT